MAKEQIDPVVADKPITESTLLSALEIVLAKFAGQPQNGLTADTLKEVLLANTEAVRRAAKPENATAPNVSAFNPGGGLRPELSRPTFFVGARMTEDLLTNHEIEAFNAITRSCEARGGKWSATVRRNGDTHELHVLVPHKEIDQRMELPSLALILRELREGPDAVNVDTMAERIAALEKQLASQGASSAA